MMKICSKCKQIRELKEFSKRINRNNKPTSWCKDCINEHSKKYRIKNIEKERYRHKIYRINHKKEMKEWSIKYNLKRQFNISIKEYDKLLKRQKNRCAICGIHQSKVDKRFAVDHNHDTGFIRGLLCISCNVGIANLKESIEIFKKAIKYLKGYRRS